MGQQRSVVFSPQSSLTPARDTHLGLTLLIMDCLEAMESPEQAGLSTELGRWGGLARMLSAYFTPLLKGITWENNPFINNVNINIKHQGGNSVGKAQTIKKKQNKTKNKTKNKSNWKNANTES